MYCYCIEKSEIQKKRSANKNGSHFENFWVCPQVFVFWGLAGMGMCPLKRLVVNMDQLIKAVYHLVYFSITLHSFFKFSQTFTNISIAR